MTVNCREGVLKEKGKEQKWDPEVEEVHVRALSKLHSNLPSILHRLSDS